MNGQGPPSPRRAAGLRLALAVLAGAALSAPTHAAELYKWTASDGVVQFSDMRPPPEIYQSADSMTVGEWLAAEQAVERIERRERLRRALEAELAPEPEPEPEPEPPAEQVESRYDCAEARDILAAQQQPDIRLYSVDENGRFVRSTAEEVQATIAEWEQAVEVLCKENIELVRPGNAESETGNEATPAAGDDEPVVTQ